MDWSRDQGLTPQTGCSARGTVEENILKDARELFFDIAFFVRAVSILGNESNGYIEQDPLRHCIRNWDI